MKTSGLFAALLLCGACLLSPAARGEAAADGSDAAAKMDPTLEPGARAVLATTVGFALPGETEGMEWMAPQGLKGAPESFEDLRGKVVVIQSFDTISPRGRGSLRRMAKILGNFDSSSFQLVGLHTPDNAERADRFVSQLASGMPVVVDPDGAWCDELGIYKTPATIIVDRNGVIRHAGIGLRHVPGAVGKLINQSRDEGPGAPALPARDERIDFSKATTVAPSYPPVNRSVGRAVNVQGKKAPAIEVHQWFNGEPETEGKVVIVEFWATWCGPCIRNIPHMNKLASEFKDTVVAIGVSDEGSAKVRKFFAGRQFSYKIATDPRRRLYGFPRPAGIPHAYIQSPDGIVRWQGHPAQISSELLGQIVEASGLKTAEKTETRWITDAG